MALTGNINQVEAKQAVRWSAIYDKLKSAILSHRLTPGTKLPEDELAAIYSVSRTVIRSALQGLAHDRLVRLELNRGAFVAQPSQKEAREVFEVRALVEPRAAALAAERATKADETRLRLHLEEEHKAVRAGRDGDAIMLSGRFHVAVAEIAEHLILCEFIAELVSRSSLIIALYWGRREMTCESHAHLALLEAIAANQPSKASELMNSHLVDLLSGLDLALGEKAPQSLSDILR